MNTVIDTEVAQASEVSVANCSDCCVLDYDGKEVCGSNLLPGSLVLKFDINKRIADSCPRKRSFGYDSFLHREEKRIIKRVEKAGNA
jgi:hypothetical protein